MFRSENWERFDENFDSSDGGALYVNTSDDGEEFAVAGTFWLDGGYDELHYFAAICKYYVGEQPYADDVDSVNDQYLAADAFSSAVDNEIWQEIGWFSTMDEAVEAVEDCIAEWQDQE